MRRARGFTLVEVVVVLVIFGIILTMAAAVTRGLAASQRLSVTTARMATVDSAIVQFVAVQKRMPCPADGSIATAGNNAGVEIAPDANGCSTQTNGVVPWVSLGLTETDATDGWGRRFTYRTDVTLGRAAAGVTPAGMDMSLCDPASTVTPIVATATCNTACTASSLGSCTPPQAFLLNKGLQVQNVAGTVVMNPGGTPATGAAYVLISAGETGGGAYLNTGNLGATSGTDGTREQLNYANRVLQAIYIDDSLNETAGNTHFDDLVTRPSVMTVVTKAALGPRSH